MEPAFTLTLLQVVVVFRTLLQDRIAALNGRTVKYLLNQDLSAFVRLVGLSVVQASFCNPSQLQIAFMTTE